MTCQLTTSRDQLFEQYDCLFSPSRNRNSASHIWANHLLHHSQSMSSAQFVEQAQGFCAVSASPISSTNEFVQDIATTAGGTKTVSFNHCCWPCACDIKDASNQGKLHIHPAKVKVTDGSVDVNYVVIDDPCRTEAVIPKEAPAVSCRHGRLKKAMHIETEKGPKVVIGFAFEKKNGEKPSDELHKECEERARNGYQSGMGTIFRNMLSLT